MSHEQGSVDTFVRSVTRGKRGAKARAALFYAIRDLPYATDSASDAPSLVRLHRGNCLAKSALLADGLNGLGYHTRRVRWLYLLPNQPPEVSLLPSREGIHTAVEVDAGGHWLLVDATHDAPLARGGFVVNEWDGSGATALAYPPLGPLWREGENDAMIATAMATIIDRYSEPLRQQSVLYNRAFNDWLNRLRANH